MNNNKIAMVISFFVLLGTVVSNPEVSAYAKIAWISALSYSAALILFGYMMTKKQAFFLKPVLAEK